MLRTREVGLDERSLVILMIRKRPVLAEPPGSQEAPGGPPEILGGPRVYKKSIPGQSKRNYTYYWWVKMISTRR